MTQRSLSRQIFSNIVHIIGFAAAIVCALATFNENVIWALGFGGIALMALSLWIGERR